MIWMLIEVILIVCAIVSWIIYNKSVTYNDIFDVIGTISTILGASLGLIIIIVFIMTRAFNDIRIQDSKIEYDGLIKRYEIINSDYEDMSKSDVIKDITEWNRDVSSAKYWSSNLWTNWFWSKKYVDSLQYIELEE